jgi:hypothetical protein
MSPAFPAQQNTHSAQANAWYIRVCHTFSTLEHIVYTFQSRAELSIILEARLESRQGGHLPLEVFVFTIPGILSPHDVSSHHGHTDST